MSMSHIGTPCGQIDGPNGKGHAWVRCECGYATPRFGRLKDAWIEFRSHYPIRGRHVASSAREEGAS